MVIKHKSVKCEICDLYFDERFINIHKKLSHKLDVS